MPHRHKIYDTDPYFVINPLTRIIKNETSSKITLIQHDHNSERFTFEIPRFLEEHDMSECNVVQVHYINIESGNRNQNEDVYDITDLHIDPDDDDKVICSWLVSGNATKYVGSLNFVVRFSCVTDGVIDYAWNTAVFSGISISTGIFNTDAVAEEYSDIIASWTARIEALEQGGSGGSGGSARATATIELSSDSFNPEKPNDNALGIYDISETVPHGVEIAKIEGTFDGVTWFDFKRMYETDSASPYFYANTHTFNDEDMGMLCIVSIMFVAGLADWANRIVAYELQGVKLTYYTN